MVSDETIKSINDVVKSDYTENIVRLLETFNYEATLQDAYSIRIAIMLVENSIKNLCNISKIPEELSNVVITRVCGRVLETAKNLGKMQIEEGIKSIQEGDTQVVYSDSNENEAERVNSLITELINFGKEEVLCFRKIRW